MGAVRIDMCCDRKYRVSMAPPHSMASILEKAIAAFAAGKPVMIFDSAFRERETDLLRTVGNFVAGVPTLGGR